MSKTKKYEYDVQVAVPMISWANTTIIVEARSEEEAILEAKAQAQLIENGDWDYNTHEYKDFDKLDIDIIDVNDLEEEDE